MQLLVKGTRRIIFILCAVSDAKRYYSSPLKLATLQTSLKHVRRSAHNADFCRLSISKHPANAHNINNFSPLAVQDDHIGGALALEANRLFYSNPRK